MKVRALFTDYDGTLAPLGVPREESEMFKGVGAELRKISMHAPVCIVTAKDYEFTYPRSRFATAWACVSGLDVRLKDGGTFTRKALRRLDEALALARSGEKRGTFTELKRGPAGELLGVGIDWTGSPRAGEAMVRGLGRLRQKGHLVAYDGESTHADIFAAAPDKGRALRLLKRELKVGSGTMFMGDSVFDNPAFQEAEMTVGISHGQSMDELRCGYVVDQSDVRRFLHSLGENGMEFGPRLQGVTRKGA